MSPPSLDLMSNTSLTDNQPLSLTDSAIGSSTSPEAPHKSQCSSLSDRDEENFESFGENVDIEFDNENDVDTLDGRFVRVNSNASPLSDRNLSRRNTWLRTSLRRSPGSNNVDNIVPPRRWGSLRYPNKRVSSNAYASALYNNNVGSSPSGRSFKCFLNISSASEDLSPFEESRDEGEEGELDNQLEYDDWPGQVFLISEMTTSSSCMTTAKDDDEEDISRSLDDLHLESMINSSSNSSFIDYNTSTTDNFQSYRPSYSSSVQMLQEQVGVLVESQATTDDKYTKVKQDNSSLTTRIHMLEEHIRDLEIKSEERIEDEQKRNKELIVRLEREKTLEIENYTIRLQTLERENSHLQEENSGLRTQVDHLKLEGHNKEELLQEIQTSHTFLQKQYTELEENLRKKQDSFSDKNLENSRLIEELYKETETLKDSLNDRKNDGFIGCGSADSDDDVFGNLASRISEMENEIRSLRDKNGSLQETNEELQAQMLNRGLEEGKILLNGPSDDSLAAEFEAMNEKRVKFHEEEGQTIGASEYKKIRNALKEQQEVNTSLRRYIDGILMNIMEKYPELLERNCDKFPSAFNIRTVIYLLTNNLSAPSLHSIVGPEHFKKEDHDLTGRWDPDVPGHMPKDFKTKFPSTRIVLDGTEIAIENPKNVTQQFASWSSYKNRNTLKEKERIDIFFIEFCFSINLTKFEQKRDVISVKSRYLNSLDREKRVVKKSTVVRILKGYKETSSLENKLKDQGQIGTPGSLSISRKISGETLSPNPHVSIYLKLVFKCNPSLDKCQFKNLHGDDVPTLAEQRTLGA
ncbi:RAB11FIP3_4 [Lepeophtheirus salmonis]|uniref:RAB11FIP3_4 n=1 Tax=Lepeophtheirus salmonis TaxID=72036 RepID=A0A7R8CBL8_LEPSM|nr:RAB11FIP3_4 [Lepeophtheirus salmonis]CAF2760462.1 RAB11FIP3_4 [Lepeophtheirus salmonis]